MKTVILKARTVIQIMKIAIPMKIAIQVTKIMIQMKTAIQITKIMIQMTKMATRIMKIVMTKKT